MELTNEFTVAVDADRAWDVLTDLERIAPCMPGAQLQEVEGDEHRGAIKVKVGPIAAQYKGSARFVSKDPVARTAVLEAKGRELRGQGTAAATVTAALHPDGSSTRVVLSTDLRLTGKVAQFGRGVLADVSEALLGQFATNLEADLAADGPSVGAAAEPSGSTGTAEVASASPADSPAPPPPPTPAAEPSGSAGTAGEVSASAAPPAPAGGVRRIDAPPAEPVDLLAVAGAPSARRLAPLAVGLLVVVLLVWRRRARR